MNNAKKEITDLNYFKTAFEACSGSDAIIICTEWSIFRTPDFSKLKDKMNSPVIFDGRNLFDIGDLKSEGFYYSSIGRKTV